MLVLRQLPLRKLVCIKLLLQHMTRKQQQRRPLLEGWPGRARQLRGKRLRNKRQQHKRLRSQQSQRKQPHKGQLQQIKQLSIN